MSFVYAQCFGLCFNYNVHYFSLCSVPRTGRSGRNIRVRATVEPQCRVRASAVEGKDVLVTKGEYRGLSGTIESTMPGGWYVVGHLFKVCVLH